MSISHPQSRNNSCCAAMHSSWCNSSIYFPYFLQFSSVQFSRSIVSDSLRPHELQHARPPCPSPTPGVHPDSRPSSQWCHPAISSSVVPFSSCPQSLPASESFPMCQLFAWGGQSRKVNKLSNVNYILSISMMLMFRLNLCDKENHDMLWGGQLHHYWSWFMGIWEFMDMWDNRGKEQLPQFLSDHPS